MLYGLGQLVLPESAEGSWKERLFGALDAYLMLLFDLPGLAEMSLTTLKEARYHADVGHQGIVPVRRP